MAISLNALFNKPTREEKSRKQLLDQQQEFAAGQAALDQSRAKERMAVAKDLELQMGAEKFKQLTDQQMQAAIDAGLTPEQAKQVIGAGRIADMQKAANTWDEERARSILKVPGLKAMFESVGLDTGSKEMANRGLLAEGRKGMSYDLGATGAAAEVAENKYKGAQAAGATALLPQQQAVTAAELAQREQAAKEYQKAEGLRGLLQQGQMQAAQQRQGFLQQIANDPLYQAITAGGIDPRAFGAGVAGPYGVGTLPLPGGKQAGLLGGQPPRRKTAAEALEEALGGDVKLVQ